MSKEQTAVETAKKDLRVKNLVKDFKYWYYIVELEGIEYRVKLFDFQKEQKEQPDIIKCLIKKTPDGATTVLQDQIPLIASRYKEGSVYKFTIKKSQERSGQYDAYGTEGFRFHLNNPRGKSYSERQVVACKVMSIDGIKVNVEEEEVAKPTEEIVTAMISPDALRLIASSSKIDTAVIKIMTKAFRSEPHFHHARQSLKNGQAEWLTEGITVLTQNMGRWLTAMDKRPKSNHRKLALNELKRMCIDILEHSGLVTGDAGGVRKMREALSECIRLCDEYKSALLKIKEKTKNGELAIESYKADLLSSLERTGYVYEPVGRLGTLTCAMELDDDTREDVIHKMFDILASRPLSDWQEEPLRGALVRMLSTYADTQADKADRVMDLSLGQNKAVVSDTARALAIVMMLTDETDEMVNRHEVMSRLCRYSTLFQTNLSASLNNKAYGNLFGINEIKLPFSWSDLKSSTDVLCFKVSQSLTPQPDAESRLYEGRRASVCVAGNNITILPAVKKNQMRDSFPEGLTPWRDIRVKVGSRDYVRSVKADTDDIQELRQMWRDVEDSLLDTQDDTHHMAQVTMPRRTKLMVEKGDKVTIRVTGSTGKTDKSGNPLFRTVVVNDHLRGEGVLSPRDIVHYNVIYAHHSNFLDHNGNQLLLKATVEDVSEDGAVKFDLMKDVDAFVGQFAKEFIDGDQILCRMTIPSKYGNLLISEDGFSLMVPFGDDTPQMTNGDLVWVTVTDAYMNGTVRADFAGFADEGETLSDSECFHNLLLSYSEGKVFEGEEDDAENENEDLDEEDEQSRDDLDRDEVMELMNIVDRQSTIESNRAQTFSMLAVARLLAIVIDDQPKAMEYQERMALISMMDSYARNQWIDPDDFDRHYSRSIGMMAGNPDMEDHAMRLFCLSRIEKGGSEQKILDITRQKAGTLTGNVARLVLAYNMSDGFSLTSVRREIKEKINALLSIKSRDESEREHMGEEGPTQEFKESIVFPPNNNMRPDIMRQMTKILTVICGMMNSKGGRLLVGVNDSGMAVGCEADFKELSHTENYDEQKARDLMSNCFTNFMSEHMPKMASLYADQSFEFHGGRWVFVVDTRPTPVVMDVDGDCYRRVGASTRKMDENEKKVVMELKSENVRM